MSTLVHITHEATHKIGGIGTVLEGLLTSRAYVGAVERSVLVGTWSLGTPIAARLGNGGRVLYSICDGIDEDGYRALFRPIEEKFQVWITYGTRRFGNHATDITNEVDVLLIEAAEMDPRRLVYWKATLYQRFGIASGSYEQYSDYEHWTRIAEPAYEAAMALIRANTDASSPVFFISHEYMGMPTALKAITEREPGVYACFYAHEVATIRPHVENHPGHDTRFYNLMRQARSRGLYISDVLGDQWGSYRHALIDRAQFCDGIFAVGDWIVEEFRFLSPAFDNARIDLVYNGIPAYALSLGAKQESKARLVRYAENLLGFTPDYVFSHVTRFVTSKGLWRDLRVLYHLDRYLASAGKSAVFFVLSTEVATGRPASDVARMEAEYGWPLVHREGYPDLTGQEIPFWRSVEGLNAATRASRTVFVNQFGWNRDRCGSRMPGEMEFMDIRQGTDVEFGQSIYEPFGIAQVEPLSFGAICVATNVCGCVGFVRRATGGEEIPNLIVADYTSLGGGYMGVDAVAQIGWAERDSIETRNSEQVASELFKRLPKNEAETEAMIRRGYEVARKMSWEVVVSEYLLPGLERARQARDNARGK
jgi:glycosyltransferase involved in cell wall biosynthesis